MFYKDIFNLVTKQYAKLLVEYGVNKATIFYKGTKSVNALILAFVQRY